jgi:hypothetical protein
MPAMWEAEIEGSPSKAGPGKNHENLFEKIIKSKRHKGCG